MFRNFRMWTLIKLYETLNDKTPDLIPKVWIIDHQTCWYPMSFRLTTIKALAKGKAEPNMNEWEKFKIKIVENDIDDYEYGIKLMYKLIKNKSKINLHSDAEKKGRGMRKKLQNEQYNNFVSNSSGSDSESFSMSVKHKSKKELQCPPFPKKKKESHGELEDNICERSSTRHQNINSDSRPIQPLPVTVESGSNEINTLLVCDNLINSEFFESNIALGENIISTPQNSFSTINDVSPMAFNMDIPTCKLSAKTHHSCSFELSSNSDRTDEKHQLLISLGHQLCRLSADFRKFKSHMNYLKLELTSFIEDRSVLAQNSTSNQEKNVDILSTFPIKDEEQLLDIEKKLDSDALEYYNKLLSAFLFASEGKTVSKVTNNLLKTIFTNEFATHYSWKGQKEKKKLENFKIFKVIFSCIGKKFPNISDYKIDAISSIMNWFAQAPTRITRNEEKSKKSMFLKPPVPSDNHQN